MTNQVQVQDEGRPTRFFRVEHMDGGGGPFHDGTVRGGSDGFWLHVNGVVVRWPASSQTHPGDHDVYHVGINNVGNYKFGVQTPTQLRHWFPNHALRALGMVGFVIREYRVRKVVTGVSGTQCVAHEDDMECVATTEI